LSKDKIPGGPYIAPDDEKFEPKSNSNSIIKSPKKDQRFEN
jgi:hypothetical protein